MYTSNIIPAYDNECQYVKEQVKDMPVVGILVVYSLCNNSLSIDKRFEKVFSSL